MKYAVEMLAFYDEPNVLREVEVPEHMVRCSASINDVLGLIFQFGQNDFQRRDCCSISVGDVIRYGNRNFVVQPMGFAEISEEQVEELQRMPRVERRYSNLVSPPIEVGVV